MTTTTFIVRLLFAVGAFNAANQTERPVLRAFGFAYLLIFGIFGTLGAIAGGSWHTWVVGPGGLAAAGYAFFSNR
ncbi:MAG: hypothetical protein HS117_05405 [Verrucomicrobiaceae bacterium]|jgi:hypothetical protein|nr:hypothetical protein [Verrucomicrobiaceae bacterium]